MDQHANLLARLAQLEQRLRAAELEIWQLQRRRDAEVQLPIPAVRRGVFTGTLAQGGSVTCQEIIYDANDLQVYTGQEFVAWDFFFNLSVSVTGTFKVKVSWCTRGSNRWIIDEITCEESDSLPVEEE